VAAGRTNDSCHLILYASEHPEEALIVITDKDVTRIGFTTLRAEAFVIYVSHQSVITTTKDESYKHFFS
jgi:hypothetical protein